MLRRAAAFPAAPSVGVARSPRVGVPSILRVVSGGRWACAGVIRMASDVCFGDVCWGVWWGWGGAGPPVVVCPSWVWVVVPAVVPFSSVSWSPLPPLPGSWVVSCPHVVSLSASCPCECLPSLGALPCPLAGVLLGAPCPSLALVLPLPGVSVAGGAGWGGGAGGPGLGVGGLEPLAEGLGGVGGAEALDRIAEEGLPCRLRHDGLWGGLVGVCGGAGAHLLEGMHHVHPFSPSRSSGPLHPAAELLQSGGRPPGEVGGGPGGGGVRARGRGAAGGGRGPAVVAGVAVPGGAGAAAAGAGGGGRVRAEGGAGGGGGHGAAVARPVASGGAGVVVAGAGGGGWVRVAGGTGSPAGRVGGGGGGRGEAVACLAASGGAGVVVAGAGGGGLVWPVGGGGGGHGAAVALVVVPGGAEATGAGSRGVVVAPGGAGAARVGGSGAVGVWAPWASVPCGGGAGTPPFPGPGLIARVGPVRRRRRPLGGLAR